MTLTKTCTVCGKEFPKPKHCGKPEWETRKFCSIECKCKSQIGKPTWKKGKMFPSVAKKVPCRICGEPTKYNGSELSKQIGQVHCGKDECRELSRKIKNDNISAKHKKDYESGKRKKIRTAWDNVSRVSAEEDLIAPHLTSMGFVRQHKLITGESSIYMPRCFWLDFADVQSKICIEVDGSVHRLRKERDERKDLMLTERGWKVIRVPATSIASDLLSVVSQISYQLTQFARK